jgi:hypothetical protein
MFDSNGTGFKLVPRPIPSKANASASPHLPTNATPEIKKAPEIRGLDHL